VLPRVAIAIGDPAGVGPEIALKAALDERVTRICRPVLFGDPKAIAAHAHASGITAQVETVALDHFRETPLEIGRVRAQHGRAAVDAARAAIAAAMAGEVAAVVAAPQTELAIKAAGIEFDGYPSFVARCTGVPADDAFLMICFDAIRIAHATLHVSLRRAIELVTPARVERVLRAVDGTLRRIGIPAPRIAVGGLNPHAGEQGQFGDEERRVIEPALQMARNAGIDVEGPFPADSLFTPQRRSRYDGIVAMYHDQGLIPVKMLAFDSAVNVTLGLPVIRTSVDHGTAFDIVGTNQADPGSMKEAIRLACHFVRCAAARSAVPQLSER